MTEPAVNSRAVLRALGDLGGYMDHPDNVTAEDLAKYLRCDAKKDVLPHLRDLKERRIVKDRRRDGKRVWVSWGAV